MKCPECGFAVTRDKCVCGWTPSGKVAEKSAGIGKCAWVAHGEQCSYPGTISFNTQGMGPWYCRFHSQPDISQSYGAQVVEQSRTYVHISMTTRDAQHLKRLGDPSYKPKVRACEELHCIKPGILRPFGRYLCETHKHGEVQYAKDGPKQGRVGNRVTVRAPVVEREEAEIPL